MKVQVIKRKIVKSRSYIYVILGSDKDNPTAIMAWHYFDNLEDAIEMTRYLEKLFPWLTIDMIAVPKMQIKR